MYWLLLIVILLLCVQLISGLHVTTTVRRSRLIGAPKMMMTPSASLVSLLVAINDEQAKIVPYEKGIMPMWVPPVFMSLIIGTIAVPQIARARQVSKNSRNLAEMPPSDPDDPFS